VLIVIIVFKNLAKCDTKIVVDGSNTAVEKEDVEESERDLMFIMLQLTMI